MKGAKNLRNEDQGVLVTKETENSEQRKKWKPMRLTFTGDAKDIVHQGGGKLSQPGGDPGEMRKQGPTG
jgi:hypothetical protein